MLPFFELQFPQLPYGNKNLVFKNFIKTLTKYGILMMT